MIGRNRFPFPTAATEMLAAAAIAVALLGPAGATEAPLPLLPEEPQGQLGSIMPLEGAEGISKLLPLLLTSPERRQIAAEIEAAIRQGDMKAAEARLRAAVEMGTLAIVLVDRLNDPGLLPTLQSLGIRGDQASLPQTCSIDAESSMPELLELQEQLQREQEQRSALVQELAALRESHTATTEAKTADLQEALLRAQEQESNTERQLLALQEERNSLQSLHERELTATQSRISDLENQLQQERERSEASAQQLSHAQRELRDLQALKEKEAASESLRITELQEALAREKVRGDAITRELASVIEEASLQEEKAAPVFPEGASDANDPESAGSVDRFPLMPQLLLAIKEASWIMPEPTVTSAVSAPSAKAGKPAGDAQPKEPQQLRAASLSADPPKAAPAPDRSEARAEPPSASAEADDRLVERADELFRRGDVSSARLLLERSAEAGNPRAVFLLAETFDPQVLSRMGTFGLRGDAAKAKALYEKARALGSDKAVARMKAMK